MANYQKLPECIGCTLEKEPGICWGSGDPTTAKLIYIAQNPGADEVASLPMQPLVGASGRVFNRQLFEANIRRDEVYITNQVKCKTPNNREPTSLEVNKCRHLLQKELARCKADTVVLAGALAFKENIGTYSSIHQHYHPPDNVMSRMGCVEQKDGRKWIGTIHPAFVMRMPDFKHEATLHLKKALSIAGVKIPLPKVYTHPEPQDIKRHREAALDLKAFADDTESVEMPYDIQEDDYVGGMWRPDLCGFSAVPYEAFVDSFDRTAAHWADIFSVKDVWQFEHNGEHDRYDLEKIAPQLNRRWDTMIGQHWLHNNVFKYLKPHGVRLFTNLPYYDRSLEKLNRRLYCGMDNITTLLAGKEQQRRLKQITIPEKYRYGNIETLYDLILELGFPLLPILEEQRAIGANVDIKKMLLYKKVTSLQREKGEELIAKLVGPSFNWKSPQQKRDLWYKTWGLPPQYITDPKTRQKKVTTNDDARVSLRRWISQQPNQDKYRAARTFFDLQDFVSEKKKLEEYFDRVSPDLKVHVLWKPHAETYRAKSKPNFQNWPTWAIHEGYASVRSIIIADDPEEDVLASIDFDQIELWTYAAQFGIKWLLDTYESGEYIYGRVYEQVLKKPFFETDKPKTKKYRLPSVTDSELLRAKAVPLGFLYGRAGESVAAEHGWPAREGAALRNEWFRLNSELAQAHSQIEYTMKQQQLLQPPPGVLLHYPTPQLQGLNCFGQTPAAFMLYKCMIECSREFKRRGWNRTRIVLSVHDSILFNIAGGRRNPQYVVEAYEGVIKPILEQPVPWLQGTCPGFRYKHAIKIGNMWDWDMKDYSDWKEAACSNLKPLSLV